MLKTRSGYVGLRDAEEVDIAHLLQSYSWDQTSLGPREAWPAALTNTFDLVVSSGFPMLLLWGDELIVLYNDAFRQVLGKDGKHPMIFGVPSREAWAESWTTVGPLLHSVLTEGKTWSFEDLELPFTRNGRLERAFWTFSYSPVKDRGEIVGVLVVCQETTKNVVSLSEQQKFTESILEASPTFTYIYDIEKKQHVFVSPQLSHVLGNVEEEKIQDESLLLSSIHPDDLAAVNKTIEEAAKARDGQFKEMEYRIRRKDGGYLWLADRLRIFKRAKSGSVTQLLGVAADITERKNLEERLIRQYDELQMLYNSAPIGLCLLDLDYKYVRINQRLAEINGVSVADHIGRTVREIVPDIADKAEALLQEVVDKGEALMDIEIVGYTKAQPGIERIWKENWFPIKDENGKTVAVSIVAEEVTEQRRAQQSLSQLANAMPQLVWIADGKGQVISYNNQVEKYDGVYKDASGSWVWTGLIHQDDLVETGERWRAALANGGVYSMGHRLNVKGQGYRWHLSRAYPHHQSDGSIDKWFGTATDIHEQKVVEQQLKITKTQLELTIQNIPAMVYLLDTKGQVIYLNDKGAELFGVNQPDPASVSFLKLHELIKDRYDVLETNGAPLEVGNSPTSLAFRTGLTHQRTLIFKSKLDDSVRYLATTSSPLFGEDGKISMLLTSVTDVTLERLADMRVRESEESFRTLAESLPQLVWMTDEHGNQLYASGQWEEYSGVKPKNSETWNQIIHPDDRSAVESAWANSLQHGAEYKLDVRLKNKSGQYRWHLIQANALRNEEGRIYKWIGSFTDVHEQKELTEELERLVSERTEELIKLKQVLLRKNIDLANAQKFLQTVLDSSVEIVVAFDKSLNFTFLNRKAEEFMRKTSSELLGKNLLQVYPRMSGTETHELLKKALLGEPSYVQQRRAFANDDRVLESYLIPYTDDDEIAGVVTLQRDITEFIKLTDELKKSNDDLLRSNSDLEQFAHVTSHDLKEPVRKIKLYGNMLRDKHYQEFTDDAKKYLERLSNSANRISAMIDGILQYSSVHSIEQTFEVIDLNALVAEILDDVEFIVARTGATITSSGLPTITGSRTLMYQLFYNLINNALKFIDMSRKPVVKVVNNGTVELNHILYHKIDVVDNGIGFEQAFADKIFESFRRLHSKDRFEGTGLGLALCKRIILRHGGLISAKSALNEGAVFSLWFPLDHVRQVS